MDRKATQRRGGREEKVQLVRRVVAGCGSLLSTLKHPGTSQTTKARRDAEGKAPRRTPPKQPGKGNFGGTHPTPLTHLQGTTGKLTACGGNHRTPTVEAQSWRSIRRSESEKKTTIFYKKHTN